jgi:hypothetical protein
MDHAVAAMAVGLRIAEKRFETRSGSGAIGVQGRGCSATPKSEGLALFRLQASIIASARSLDSTSAIAGGGVKRPAVPGTLDRLSIPDTR